MDQITAVTLLAVAGGFVAGGFVKGTTGMGLPLVAFFTNLLVFGAAIGLAVSGLVLRYGLGAESLAWVAIFAVAPVSGIYYPISVLPDWLQPIACPNPPGWNTIKIIIINIK